MAAITTLNAKNLETLGAERLAVLLMEISTGNAAAKQRLRMALAGAQSPLDLAKTVRKRLAALATAKSFHDWRGARNLAADLNAQRTAITETIAPAHPEEALDLLWRLMALAPPLFSRYDDSNGDISAVLQQACRDLGHITARVRPMPDALARQVFAAITTNDFGQFDGLIELMAPTLGPEGLAHLKRLVVDLSNTSVPRPAKKDRVAIGWATSGPIYQDDMAERSRQRTVQTALKDIADAEGDVDAFIAQYDQETRRVPTIAAQIAQRLLAAGRAPDALAAIEAADPRKPGRHDFPVFEWEDARIEVLDALGRPEDAQKARLACFERFLSAPHLRAYLKRLNDFDDLAAEETALKHAAAAPILIHALHFLITWPALDVAASMVIQRAAELDGNIYEVLTPAAEALRPKHPLAAVLTLRAMIDYTLSHNRTTRYNHAARHLRDCESLASDITDFGQFEPHQTYTARLRQQHDRKTSFWSLFN